MADSKTARRTQLSADERRHLLLNAALVVMKRDGVKAATTRAICAEARMPHGAFHYCFHTKTELYEALLAADINVELDQAWSQIEPSHSITDGIHALLNAYWTHVQEDPAAQIVLTELTTLALRDPDLAQLPAWEQGTSQERVIYHLERLATRARVHYAVPIELLADLVVAMLSGITISWLATRDDRSARQALDESARLFSSYARPCAQDGRRG